MNGEALEPLAIRKWPTVWAEEIPMRGYSFPVHGQDVDHDQMVNYVRTGDLGLEAMEGAPSISEP
jgi:hypothetical protein